MWHNWLLFLFSWYVADGMESEHKGRTVVTCRASEKQDVDFLLDILKQESFVAYLWEYWSPLQITASWPAIGWSWLSSTRRVTDAYQMESAGERWFFLDCYNHSYYKELVRKPGKLQRNKQSSKDLCWKIHDPAQSFVLCSHTLAELRNRHVSIG